jgi:hypothetical protein
MSILFPKVFFLHIRNSGARAEHVGRITGYWPALGQKAGLEDNLRADMASDYAEIMPDPFFDPPFTN